MFLHNNTIFYNKDLFLILLIITFFQLISLLYTAIPTLSNILITSFKIHILNLIFLIQFIYSPLKEIIYCRQIYCLFHSLCSKGNLSSKEGSMNMEICNEEIIIIFLTSLKVTLSATGA